MKHEEGSIAWKLEKEASAKTQVVKPNTNEVKTKDVITSVKNNTQPLAVPGAGEDIEQ